MGTCGPFRVMCYITEWAVFDAGEFVGALAGSVGAATGDAFLEKHVGRGSTSSGLGRLLVTECRPLLEIRCCGRLEGEIVSVRLLF